MTNTLQVTAYEQSIKLARNSAGQLIHGVIDAYKKENGVDAITQGTGKALVLREQARILGTLHDGSGEALLRILWEIYRTQSWRNLKGYEPSDFREWADADLKSVKSVKYQQALCLVIERVFTHIYANRVLVDESTGETANIESAIAHLGPFYLKALSSEFHDVTDPAMKSALIQIAWKAIANGDNRSDVQEELKRAKLGGQPIKLPAFFVYQLSDDKWHVHFDVVLDSQQYALLVGAITRHAEIKLDGGKPEVKTACLPETLDTNKQETSI